MSDVDAFETHEGRGSYFYEQKKYSDAISEYIKAIDKLIKLDKFDTEEGYTSEHQNKVTLTLMLCDMYESISFCYKDNEQYYEANIFLNKANQTCRSVRESGIILDRNVLEKLDAKETLIKMAKQVIISRNNQNDKKLLAKKSDSEYDSYVRSIKTLPTSFIEVKQTPKSEPKQASTESYDSLKTISMLFTLFFIALGIALFLGGQWLLGIFSIMFSMFGKSIVIYFF